MIRTLRKLFNRPKPIPHKGGPFVPERPSDIPPRRQQGADKKQTFSKVFRYCVPPGRLDEPKSVEVVGSFTHWQKVPLFHDGKIDGWHTTVHHIQGNRTHHYMLLVDGEPTFDDACDGLAAPFGHQEQRYQLMTETGPRVLMLFAQTK